VIQAQDFYTVVILFPVSWTHQRKLWQWLLELFVKLVLLTIGVISVHNGGQKLKDNAEWSSFSLFRFVVDTQVRMFCFALDPVLAKLSTKFGIVIAQPKSQSKVTVATKKPNSVSKAAETKATQSNPESKTPDK
jgi:hypothetical protein